MASSINASTAGVGGIISTADTSGDLNIQSGGSTKIAVTSSGVAVTGLSKASLPTGSVLQVVNVAFSTETASNTSTFVDTGLTATITPTSASSKILVVIHQNGIGKQNDTFLACQLLRGASVLALLTNQSGQTNSALVNFGASSSISFLDSPATTSATTYKTQFRSGQNSASVSVQISSAVSTITLMEIAA